MPLVNELPSLQGEGDDGERLAKEFEHYRCKEELLRVNKENIDKNCLKFVCNIGVHDEGAMLCDCKAPTMVTKKNFQNLFYYVQF